LISLGYPGKIENGIWYRIRDNRSLEKQRTVFLKILSYITKLLDEN
jgi:hypothetical protein